MCQEDLENMLHQGNEFYQRLIEHLSTLTVNVSDFKMGRNLQMAEQCRALGAEPPKFDDDGAGGDRTRLHRDEQERQHNAAAEAQTLSSSS